MLTDRPSEMAGIYSELHQNIQDKFNAGVEIMSPHYTQIRDGNPTTIPESYLPKTYSPPAFRVSLLVSASAGLKEVVPAKPSSATP